MKARVYLTGYVDVDVLHPTFAEMLDPTKPEADDIGDREWLALDVYLNMLIRRALDAGKSVEEWEVSAFESVCRVCSCTDDHACAGGCIWVEADLCSACAPEATAIG